MQIHGTRNARNIAKALITAFEAQLTPEELQEQRLLQQSQAPAQTVQPKALQLGRMLHLASS